MYTFDTNICTCFPLIFFQELYKQMEEQRLQHEQDLRDKDREHERVMQEKEEEFQKERTEMEKDIRKLVKLIDKLKKKMQQKGE